MPPNSKIDDSNIPAALAADMAADTDTVWHRVSKDRKPGDPEWWYDADFQAWLIDTEFSMHYDGHARGLTAGEVYANYLAERAGFEPPNLGWGETTFDDTPDHPDSEPVDLDEPQQ